MKRFYSLIVVLFVFGVASMAQDFSYESYPKKFELSLNGQLFTGDCGVMEFSGARLGYRFNPNWSLKAGYSVGVGSDWRTRRIDIADFGVSHISRNNMLKNFEVHTTFGAGYLWNRQGTAVSGKVLGMVDLESRYYVSKNGYLGATLKAYVGNQYVQTSFLGLTWGIRF